MLRDIVIFLAGFEALHTLLHLLLPYFVTLPLEVGHTAVTPTFNFWGFLINGAITIGLILLASRMKRV